MMTSSYTKLTSVPAHLIVDAMKRGERKYRVMDKEVSIASNRMLTYTKGVHCVHCGIEGTHFTLEANGSDNWHFNLYTESGRMMTSDHILAKAKGGSNSVNNRQPMCEKCNGLKGDYESIEAAIEARKERERAALTPEAILEKAEKFRTTIEHADNMLKAGESESKWRRIKEKATESLSRYMRQHEAYFI